jgi:hypothetical protein
VAAAKGRRGGRQGDDAAQYGPVETKVRADLDALVTVHPMGEALTAMSINLARVLDEGAGLATAAINRELRANLVELARMEEGDDDLGDDLSRPSRGSSAVRDAEDS